MSSNRDPVSKFINGALGIQLRAAGLRRRGLDFRRRSKEVLQVINFQLSQWNAAEMKQFYVNVGLAFDANRTLLGRQLRDDLKEAECCYRARLETLVDGAPSIWTLHETDDLTSLQHHLWACLSRLLRRLDQIDSATRFLESGLGESPAYYGLSARLFYSLGSFDRAREYLLLEVAAFPNRPGVSYDALVRRYNLHELDTQ